jgi:hypothetical protein
MPQKKMIGVVAGAACAQGFKQVFCPVAYVIDFRIENNAR